ncbi:hypothetical protein HD806DRAFT_525486 [Xylariaceae sp. AK1471]|nr:hypothetical protein HD806DRAFT_525486 [Xylariaceae sp. AK1471]
MEVLCKAFRTPKAKEHPSVSTACWKLERYEIQTSTNSATTSSKPIQRYRLGPVMTLSDELLPSEMMQHRCWQRLFDMGSSILVNMEQRYLENFEHDGSVNSRNGKGLEVPFQMMITLAAVEFPLIVDGGIIFIGYETVLVPVSIKDDVAQFHLFTSDNGQINPYTMDLGTRLKTEDFQQFPGFRCFLGWCQFAQINLGTRALPADVKYSRGREKDKSLQLNGFSVLSQLGASAPLTAILGVQANFEYASHRRQFTPAGSYYKLLRDTALELAIIYDSSKKQCWLVPKLSLLMHMCQAYASQVVAPRNNDKFVNGHADATELIKDLEPLGDNLVFGGQVDGFRFRQLILGLNINLLTTVKAIQKSSSGKLYGFEFMDVVSSPGRGTCMKSFHISSPGRNWLDLVNVVDAVVVCSNIGAVITAIPSNSGTAPVSLRNNPICNGLPEGLDYLAATVPCLNRLVGRQGSKLTPNSGSERIMASKQCFWNIKGDPFKPCSHDPNSPDSCWMRPDLTQKLVAVSYFGDMIRGSKITQPAMSRIPDTGAVAFATFRSKELRECLSTNGQVR